MEKAKTLEEKRAYLLIKYRDLEIINKEKDEENIIYLGVRLLTKKY